MDIQNDSRYNNIWYVNNGNTEMTVRLRHDGLMVNDETDEEMPDNISILILEYAGYDISKWINKRIEYLTKRAKTYESMIEETYTSIESLRMLQLLRRYNENNQEE